MGVTLTSAIVSSARNAVTHRRNCQQLAEHVRVIDKLLGKLKSTDLINLPAVKEPLDGLEEALKKAVELVDSCRDNSCLYMVAMGWTVVYQFRHIQHEIDRYLRLVPLISLVHEFRMQVGTLLVRLIYNVLTIIVMNILHSFLLNFVLRIKKVSLII
uniref:MCAfunc domain-containing protein n=1 Tax=Cannabis sativa TaxID=3483 RepID=A0A803QTY2_CANSA